MRQSPSSQAGRFSSAPSTPLPRSGFVQSALGAQLGLWVGCEDGAGPFQAVPHAGVPWQPREQPATQPHEYIRGGTTKILTLFHPASGQVRLQPAPRCTNAVLHPWLRERLSAILTALPVPQASLDSTVTRAAWTVWQAGPAMPFPLPHTPPPLRPLPVLGNPTCPQNPDPVWGAGASRV